MKVAVVGAGIAGISAAWHLNLGGADVHLLERGSRIGGHTHTHALPVQNATVSVDTGFIIFNERHYPEFCAWLHDLGIPAKPTNMSFAVRDEIAGIEYGTTDLRAVTSNAGQLLRPAYWRLWRDLSRFYRNLRIGEIPDVTLGKYLSDQGYGDGFVHSHIVPMCAALWSQPAQESLGLSLRHVIEFMRNHQLLQITGRPVWQVVDGGSCEYLGAFEQRFGGRISTNVEVADVRRQTASVGMTLDGAAETFDAVVIACHSDQALTLLTDATEVERRVLGQIPYQSNQVSLHSDTSFMPVNRACWSSWNCVRERDDVYVTTYWMNRLQGLTCPEQFFVTLNPAREPEGLHWQGAYEHPYFSQPSYAAQQRWSEVCAARTFFAGAYWDSGFHESGFVSGQRCAQAILQRMESAHAA